MPYSIFYTLCSEINTVATLYLFTAFSSLLFTNLTSHACFVVYNLSSVAHTLHWLPPCTGYISHTQYCSHIAHFTLPSLLSVMRALPSVLLSSLYMVYVIRYSPLSAHHTPRCVLCFISVLLTACFVLVTCSACWIPPASQPTYHILRVHPSLDAYSVLTRHPASSTP